MSEHIRGILDPEHYSRHFLKFRTNFNNCILKAFRGRGWTQTDGDDWDLYWSEKDEVARIFQFLRVGPTQKINHHRNYYEICRKDNLYRNFKKYKKNLERSGAKAEALLFNFMPLTFILPSEYPIFADQFKKLNQQSDHKLIWIMKPAGRSQGKGIFLFKNLSQISNWCDPGSQPQAYIAQRYIHNPLLFGGKKFDLRIYVLVTCYCPLTIYLYRAGFARFTHQRYDVTRIQDASIHLTNVNVQKNCDNYDEKRGGKWQIDKLRFHLLAKLGDETTGLLFWSIQDRIIKTLQVASKIMWPDKRCFQLYGFDVMIDDCLKPWIIQVNGSPSMTANTPIDCQLKCGLLDDVMTVVDMEGLLQGDQKQIGGFDLIFKQKPINTNNSRLGCINDRVRQLKTLAAQIKVKKNTKNEAKPAQHPPLSDKRVRAIKEKPITSDPKQKQHNLPKVNITRAPKINSSNTIKQQTKSNFLIRKSKTNSIYERSTKVIEKTSEDFCNDLQQDEQQQAN